MRSEAYRDMRALEDDYWWYRSLRHFAIGEVGGAKKILDAGCGTGGTLRALADRDAVGVDYSPEALALASQSGVKGLICGSVTDLPLRDSSFDAVFLLDVIYHRGVRDDLAAVAECSRVLKSGGVMVLQAPAYEWLWSRHDIDVHGVRRYTKKGIEKLALAAGLGIQKVGYRNLLPLPAAILLRKCGAKGGPAPLPRWLNGIFYCISLAENIAARIFPLPAGLSVFCVAQKM